MDNRNRRTGDRNGKNQGQNGHSVHPAHRRAGKTAAKGTARDAALYALMNVIQNGAYVPMD